MKERRPPHRKVLPFLRARRIAGTGGGGDAPAGQSCLSAGAAGAAGAGRSGGSGSFVAPDTPETPARPDMLDMPVSPGIADGGFPAPELVVVQGGGKSRAPRSLGAGVLGFRDVPPDRASSGQPPPGDPTGPVGPVGSVGPVGRASGPLRCTDGLTGLRDLLPRPGGGLPVLRRLPLLERIVRRFADAAARRMGALCGVGCEVTPGEARLYDMAGCAGLLARPAMHRFGVVPLEGTAALLFDHPLRETATWLALGADPRVMAGAWAGTDGDTMSLQPGSPTLPTSFGSFGLLGPPGASGTGYGGRNVWQPGHAESALCAHLGRQLQLDLEWAFLPYFEIETSGCDAPPGEPGGQPVHAREALRPDWTALGEPLVATAFEVVLHWPSPVFSPVPSPPSIPQELAPPVRHPPASSWGGRLVLALPLAMLLPLADLLADEAVLLAPEQTETAESAHDRLQVLSDADLAKHLAGGHPQTAAVVAARLAPLRRDAVLALLGPELGTEVRRRMARRRLFRQVLSPEQRFVVRTLALGEVHAAQTVAALRPEAAARFVRVMRGLGSLYAEQVEAVLRDDGAGLAGAEDLVLEGEAQVRRLLMRALGPDDMREVRACLDAADAPDAADAAAGSAGTSEANGIAGAEGDGVDVPGSGPEGGQARSHGADASHGVEPFALLLGVPAVTLARLLTAEGLAVAVAVLRHLAARDARRAAAVLGALPTAWAGPVAVALSPEGGPMGEGGACPVRGGGRARSATGATDVMGVMGAMGAMGAAGSLEALLVVENALCRALPEEHACRVLALPARREEAGRDAPPATALAALLRHGGDAVREAALHALRRHRAGKPGAEDRTREDARPGADGAPPFPSDDDVC